MLNTIYTIQAKIAAMGTSIDHILASIIAIAVLIIVAYLVECYNSEKENNQWNIFY